MSQTYSYSKIGKIELDSSIFQFKNPEDAEFLKLLFQDFFPIHVDKTPTTISYVGVSSQFENIYPGASISIYLPTLKLSPKGKKKKIIFVKTDEPSSTMFV